MEKEIFIKDPDFKTNLKIFHIRSYVYILDNSLPTNFSNKTHQLDEFKIMTISADRAYGLALFELNKKYPHYVGYFNFR